MLHSPRITIGILALAAAAAASVSCTEREQKGDEREPTKKEAPPTPEGEAAREDRPTDVPAKEVPPTPSPSRAVAGRVVAMDPANGTITLAERDPVTEQQTMTTYKIGEGFVLLIGGKTAVLSNLEPGSEAVGKARQDGETLVLTELTVLRKSGEKGKQPGGGQSDETMQQPQGEQRQGGEGMPPEQGQKPQQATPPSQEQEGQQPQQR